MNELIETLKPYNEILIAASLIVGVLNLFLMLAVFNEKRKIEKHALKLSDNLITNLTKENDLKGPHIFTGKPNAFVDGGVLIGLWLAAMAIFIANRETVNKSAVVESEKIEIADTVYQCKPVQRKMIKYFDVTTNTYKPLYHQPPKGCDK